MRVQRKEIDRYPAIMNIPAGETVRPIHEGKAGVLTTQAPVTVMAHFSRPVGKEDRQVTTTAFTRGRLTEVVEIDGRVRVTK